MYQAAIQAKGSIIDKNNQDKEILIEVYYGVFPSIEEATLFARQSRIGISKQKNSIEICWNGNDAAPCKLDPEDIYFLPFYDTTDPSKKDETINMDDYTKEEFLHLLWNYDDFGGDEGLMWLSARGYGSRAIN